MSRRWWTADLHMGHKNIIGLCKRPFRDLDHMHETLIRNFNSRVKPEDIVIHVGDFCVRGGDRGVEGSRKKPMEWLKEFNGTWVLLEGNHDYNNRVKVAGTMLTGKVHDMVFVARHEFATEYAKAATAGLVFSLGIQGHVHEHWQAQVSNEAISRVYVNVGVDANRFIPISDDELAGIAHRRCKESGVKP